MADLDPNIVVMVIVGTLSSLYGMTKYYQFRVSENRKQREHLQKQRKFKLDYELQGKKLDKTPDIAEAFKQFDIKKLLADVDDEDDIDALPIPSWLKPLAKGFLKKFLSNVDAGEDENESGILKTKNY